MKRSVSFVAGMMVASVVPAGVRDPAAEERYRSKYGRHTVAEEADGAVRGAVADEAASACCRTVTASKSAMATPKLVAEQEARFAAKYGRPTPQAEARQQAVKADLAAHTRKCIEL